MARLAPRDRTGARSTRWRGISELSQRTGISRAGLYKAQGEGGNPSFETMRAILSAMGLRFAVTPLDDAAWKEP